MPRAAAMAAKQKISESAVDKDEDYDEQSMQDSSDSAYHEGEEEKRPAKRVKTEKKGTEKKIETPAEKKSAKGKTSVKKGKNSANKKTSGKKETPGRAKPQRAKKVKAPLLDVGRDIATPEELKCNVCLLPFSESPLLGRRPVHMSNCSHTTSTCESCVSRNRRYGRNVCPICSKETGTTKPDVQRLASLSTHMQAAKLAAVRCPQHPNGSNAFISLCTKCNKLCCQHCTVGGGPCFGHETVLISKMAEAGRLQIKKGLLDMELRKTHLESAKNDATELQDAVKRNEDLQVAAINEQFKQIQALVEERKVALVAEMKAFAEQDRETISGILFEIESMETKTANVRKDMERLLNKNETSDSRLLLDQYQISSHLETVLKVEPPHVQESDLFGYHQKFVATTKKQQSAILKEVKKVGEFKGPKPTKGKSRKRKA